MKKNKHSILVITIFIIFKGVWYQIQKVNAPFEPSLKCVTANYTAVNATTIFVDNKGLRP
jgi:lipocalin